MNAKHHHQRCPRPDRNQALRGLWLLGPLLRAGVRALPARMVCAVRQNARAPCPEARVLTPSQGRMQPI